MLAVARRARHVRRLERLFHEERRLIGTRHEHDVGSHHLADHAREIRVVGAAQEQRVDARLAHRRKEPLCEHHHFIAGRLVALDELDESGARRRGERDVRTGRAHSLDVGARRDRADGADDADFVVVGHAHERPSTWLDDADDRHRQLGLQVGERHGCGGVAGDDDHLGAVVLDE